MSSSLTEHNLTFNGAFVSNHGKNQKIFSDTPRNKLDKRKGRGPRRPELSHQRCSLQNGWIERYLFFFILCCLSTVTKLRNWPTRWVLRNLRVIENYLFALSRFLSSQTMAIFQVVRKRSGNTCNPRGGNLRKLGELQWWIECEDFKLIGWPS